VVKYLFILLRLCTFPFLVKLGSVMLTTNGIISTTSYSFARAGFSVARECDTELTLPTLACVAFTVRYTTLCNHPSYEMRPLEKCTVSNQCWYFENL